MWKLLAMLWFAGAATAQETGDVQATVDALIREALAKGQAYETLGELCKVAPKRLSGSPDAAAAVTWAKLKMEEFGFENIRLEPCTVTHWVRGAVEEARLLAPLEELGLRLPIVALGGSVATPADGIAAEVVEVLSMGQLRALGDAAKGKIILLNQPMDPGLTHTFEAYRGAVAQRGRGAIEAAKVGAVAVLVRSMTTRLDDHPHTGAMNYEKGVAEIPAAAISTLGADRLAALLRRGVNVSLRLRLECRTLPDAQSFNVVGEWRGREKADEIVVVGGHLDSWDLAEGAHDDGAGCAQSIEVLRLMKALDLRPRRTIRCVLFMNEENGLAGGNAYYAAHEAEMDRHVAAIESDSGGFTPRGFMTDVGNEGHEILKRYAARLENHGAERLRRGGGGADIGPMRKSGVPLLGLQPDSQRYFDLHHSALDVFAAVHERELELGAGVLAAMVFMIADDPVPLPRNKVPAAAESR